MTGWLREYGLVVLVCWVIGAAIGALVFGRILKERG